VGFHDFLSVLISGRKLKAKLSSQDSVLLAHLADRLIEIEPAFKGQIQWDERLHHIDALIATGSDNTARYFEYYFRNIPHIIRKNRSSCAVLKGSETIAGLHALGVDVFSYFGLGCRNVSKLYVPSGYDFIELLQTWEVSPKNIDHHKYANNYDYQKALLLVNKIPFFDNGCVLLREETALVSPVSVLYFEYYSDLHDLHQKIEVHREKIQCIVSEDGWFKNSEVFGHAQFPDVRDYADQIDTLKFLTS
jgi:hypothetical protein